MDVLPLEYIDSQVEPVHDYYYRVVALKFTKLATETIEIPSPASNLIRGRSTTKPIQWR